MLNTLSGRINTGISSRLAVLLPGNCKCEVRDHNTGMHGLCMLASALDKGTMYLDYNIIIKG